MSESVKAAFRVGAAAVRANVTPMVVLWLLSLATVLAYYFVPGFAALLEPLRIWQTESGAWASFLSRFFLCGVVPGIFLVSVAAIRPPHPVAVALAQGVWGGLSGIVYDCFYRMQAGWFGEGTDLLTLVEKMAVDQFVMTVLVTAPLNVPVFFWIAHNFSFRAFRERFPHPFFTRALLPNLVTNWCVWIPVSMAIYAFPVSLQLQVSGFACAFWALTCLQIGWRQAMARGERG